MVAITRSAPTRPSPSSPKAATSTTATTAIPDATAAIATTTHPPDDQSCSDYEDYEDSDDGDSGDELEVEPEVVSERRDPGFKLTKNMSRATRRLESRLADIIRRYGRNFDDEGDEIDLESGEVVVDRGHLAGLTDAKFRGVWRGAGKDLAQDERGVRLMGRAKGAEGDEEEGNIGDAGDEDDEDAEELRLHREEKAVTAALAALSAAGAQAQFCMVEFDAEFFDALGLPFSGTVAPGTQIMVPRDVFVRFLDKVGVACETAVGGTLPRDPPRVGSSWEGAATGLARPAHRPRMLGVTSKQLVERHAGADGEDDELQEATKMAELRAPTSTFGSDQQNTHKNKEGIDQQVETGAVIEDPVLDDPVNLPASALRRPGRPRKTTCEQDKSLQMGSEVGAVFEDPVPDRAVNVPASTPRPRGRPRKATYRQPDERGGPPEAGVGTEAVEAAAEVIMADGDVDLITTTAPRRRGRPRKSAHDQSEAHRHAEQEAVGTNATAVIDLTKTPTPLRRGRSSRRSLPGDAHLRGKSAPRAIETRTGEAITVNGPPADMAASATTPPRRRGRSRNPAHEPPSNGPDSTPLLETPETDVGRVPMSDRAAVGLPTTPIPNTPYDAGMPQKTTQPDHGPVQTQQQWQQWYHTTTTLVPVVDESGRQVRRSSRVRRHSVSGATLRPAESAMPTGSSKTTKRTRSASRSRRAFTAAQAAPWLGEGPSSTTNERAPSPSAKKPPPTTHQTATPLGERSSNADEGQAGVRKMPFPLDETPTTPWKGRPSSNNTPKRPRSLARKSTIPIPLQTLTQPHPAPVAMTPEASRDKEETMPEPRRSTRSKVQTNFYGDRVFWLGAKGRHRRSTAGQEQDVVDMPLNVVSTAGGGGNVVGHAEREGFVEPGQVPRPSHTHEQVQEQAEMQQATSIVVKEERGAAAELLPTGLPADNKDVEYMGARWWPAPRDQLASLQLPLLTVQIGGPFKPTTRQEQAESPATPQTPIMAPPNLQPAPRWRLRSDVLHGGLAMSSERVYERARKRRRCAKPDGGGDSAIVADVIELPQVATVAGRPSLSTPRPLSLGAPQSTDDGTPKQTLTMPSEWKLPTPPLSLDEERSDPIMQPEVWRDESSPRPGPVPRPGTEVVWPDSHWGAKRKRRRKRGESDESPHRLLAAVGTPTRHATAQTPSTRRSILSYVSSSDQGDDDELALDPYALIRSGRTLTYTTTATGCSSATTPKGAVSRPPYQPATPTTASRRRGAAALIHRNGRAETVWSRAMSPGAAMRACGREGYLCRSRYCFRCGLGV